MKFRNILTPSIDTPLTKGTSSADGNGGGPCAKAAGTPDPSFATAQAASKLSGPAATAPGAFGVGSPGMILQKKHGILTIKNRMVKTNFKNIYVIQIYDQGAPVIILFLDILLAILLFVIMSLRFRSWSCGRFQRFLRRIIMSIWRINWQLL